MVVEEDKEEDEREEKEKNMFPFKSCGWKTRASNITFDSNVIFPRMSAAELYVSVSPPAMSTPCQKALFP